MGMGYGAAYDDVIEDKVVMETCPNEYEQFIQALKNENITIEEFAQGLSWGDGEASETVHNLYEKIVEAFDKQIPKAGLGLYYHNSEEEGDRYDDVNGAYWACSNLFQLSPAGLALKGKFQRKLFVKFG